MTIIKKREELKRLVESFAFEDIGFTRIGGDEHFAEYYKKRRYRDDLYVKVYGQTFEAEIYTWNEKTHQRGTKIGTFNIHRPEEALFLLTYCLNELRVKPPVLATYKREIGYDQTNILPGRLARR